MFVPNVFHTKEVPQGLPFLKNTTSGGYKSFFLKNKSSEIFAAFTYSIYKIIITTDFSSFFRNLRF